MELIVHEFLYNKELMGNAFARHLKEEGLLTVITYEDFVEAEDESYYTQMFEDMYEFCNGRELNWGHKNYRTYQESRANLGEIHSIILAMFTGHDLFFSNDKGAKLLVDVKVNTGAFSISVKNVMDIFKEVAEMKSKCLTKNDFIILTKGDISRKDQIKEIKDLWHE